jgi:hypothetical protein
MSPQVLLILVILPKEAAGTSATSNNNSWLKTTQQRQRQQVIMVLVVPLLSVSREVEEVDIWECMEATILPLLWELVVLQECKHRDSAASTDQLVWAPLDLDKEFQV